MLPVYTLPNAIRLYGDGNEMMAEGWVEVKGQGQQPGDVRDPGERFIKEPQIASGSYSVFRADPKGNLEGKFVLVRSKENKTEETQVKETPAGKRPLREKREQYFTQGDLFQAKQPYMLIEYSPNVQANYQIIAEFVGVLNTDD